jgi:hypothetical protein
MVNEVRSRIEATAVAALAMGMLAACAPAEVDVAKYGEFTLSETKSIVQLMRNDVAGGIPPSVVVGTRNSADLSVACFPVSNDPDGLVRAWQSTVHVDVLETAAGGVWGVFNRIVTSYQNKGWKVENLDLPDSSQAVALTSGSIVAEIQLSIPKDESPVIELVSTGPCAATAGAESDEVKRLEGR